MNYAFNKVSMAPVGQPPTHFKQAVHLVESIKAKLFSTVMAPNSQAFSHFRQAMQATLQFFLASTPFSLFMQETQTALFSCILRISMILRGQAFTQAPHKTQVS
jgi:hypothetical protein